MTPSRYYLVLDGQVGGPFGIAALGEMASVHAITRDTLATPEGAENWLPLHAIPALAETLFPVTPKFQLKEKVIQETADSDKPVVIEDLLRTNLQAEARSAPPPVPVRSGQRPGSSRRRDYIISALFANGLGLAGYAITPGSAYTSIPLISYFVIINIGLYWVFYQVMSRY